MLRILGISMVLGLFAPALLAQEADVEEAANAIVAEGAADAVEQLVDLGAGSVEAAAVVIEVVANQQPAILPEVMVGLSAVMSVADFQAAADVAVAVLNEAPGQRVAQLALQITSGDSAAASSRSQGRDQGQGEERRNETANNVEDGRRGPPPGKGPPEEEEPSLLEQLLAFVFDLLGIDPPASPS